MELNRIKEKLLLQRWRDLLVQRQWEAPWKKLMKFTGEQRSTDQLLPCCCSLWDQSTERQWGERSLWRKTNAMLHHWYAPLTGRQHTITLTWSVQLSLLQSHTSKLHIAITWESCTVPPIRPRLRLLQWIYNIWLVRCAEVRKVWFEPICEESVCSWPPFLWFITPLFDGGLLPLDVFIRHLHAITAQYVDNVWCLEHTGEWL